MSKLKVFIVGTAYNYLNAFRSTCERVDRMDEADVVMFTGGEDVSPSYYGCEKDNRTRCNPFRDQIESEEYARSFTFPNVKARLGICRGAQLLCVLNGGLLVQHVNNHGIVGTHKIINRHGDKYAITSVHHQLQYPYNLPEQEYEMLFWAYPRRSTIHLGDKIDSLKMDKEPEVVHYKKSNSLAIQGHPEMMDQDHPTVLMLNSLLLSLVHES